MKFKRATFFIQTITADKDTYDFHERLGWVDISNTFGFYLNPKTKKWVATDLTTGSWICKEKTRRECAEWIEANMEAIEKARRLPVNIAAAERMKERDLNWVR